MSSTCLCKPELISSAEVAERLSIKRTFGYLTWLLTTKPEGVCGQHGTLYNFADTAEYFEFGRKDPNLEDVNLQTPNPPTIKENRKPRPNDNDIIDDGSYKYRQSTYEQFREDGKSERIARAKAKAAFVKETKGTSDDLSTSSST